MSPSRGPVSGGITVTITGTNFTDATAVNFGESPAGFTVNDDTSISVVVPPGEDPDTVQVTVTTAGGTSATSPASRFTYETPTGCAAVRVPPPVSAPG